jgi:hypothetical protein
MKDNTDKKYTLPALYLRWVGANAFGEMLGLGATLGVGALYFTWENSPRGVSGILLAFLVAVLSGALEASLLGFLQWAAYRPWFSPIRLRTWWLATLAGALMAYILGYLPSTLMDLSAAGGETTMEEPAQWVILLLAAGLGLVGGAVLSFAQWLVLRRVVHAAGVWIPANMLAWMLGMPLIFWGIDAAQKGQPVFQAVLVILLFLFLAGLVVGMVHGLALVWLAKKVKWESISN